jgi:hypothetical protein
MVSTHLDGTAATASIPAASVCCFDFHVYILLVFLPVTGFQRKWQRRICGTNAAESRSGAAAPPPAGGNGGSVVVFPPTSIPPAPEYGEVMGWGPDAATGFPTATDAGVESDFHSHIWGLSHALDSQKWWQW